jgi:hypothetical protein
MEKAYKCQPRNNMPRLSRTDAPEETMPHANAHIGANHVMGFNSSRKAAGVDDRGADAAGVEGRDTD